MNKSDVTYVYRTLTHINTSDGERTVYRSCSIYSRHTAELLGFGVGLEYSDAQLQAELHASCAMRRASRDASE